MSKSRGKRRTAQYNIAAAKANLPSLVRETLAGADVIIARDNKPLVRLVPLTGGRRAPGSAKGQITMAADFDAPLDDFTPCS
jgi:antitoxin (DNA-binding transcriptional repressor) of toxin-antitoxin stability system